MKIDLLNVDCIAFMRDLPDCAFDLAIVDPPYGVGSVTYMPGQRAFAHGGYLDHYNVTIATLDESRQRPRFKDKSIEIVHGSSAKTTIKNFGDFNVAPPPEYFHQLFRVSKNQVIFGGNYFLLPPSRCFVIWDKCQSEKFSMSMAEFAWTSFQGVSKIFRSQSIGTKTDPRIHPTQKPVKLYEWLLNLFAKPGDRILDTHLGSGSSAIAADNKGFDFVGCEIDVDYHTAACARFNKHVEHHIFSHKLAPL